jgi:hypothetical protein
MSDNPLSVNNLMATLQRQFVDDPTKGGKQRVTVDIGGVAFHVVGTADNYPRLILKPVEEGWGNSNSLHREVMNLNGTPPKEIDPGSQWAYGFTAGHKVARHVAAELVAAHHAAVPVAAEVAADEPKPKPPHGWPTEVLLNGSLGLVLDRTGRVVSSKAEFFDNEKLLQMGYRYINRDLYEWGMKVAAGRNVPVGCMTARELARELATYPDGDRVPVTVRVGQVVHGIAAVEPNEPTLVVTAASLPDGQTPGTKTPDQTPVPFRVAAFHGEVRVYEHSVNYKPNLVILSLQDPTSPYWHRPEWLMGICFRDSLPVDESPRNGVTVWETADAGFAIAGPRRSFTMSRTPSGSLYIVSQDNV